MRGSLFVSFALLMTLSHEAASQDVVSASAGVLQYFEGAVILDDQPIEHKAAVFPSLKNGSVLRTAKGRAELLLTPAVYLRLDENTSLRMLSNSLSDTRLELMTGAAILDTLNASGAQPVLVFHGSDVHFKKPGVYRFDCDLGELQAYSGQAQITHHGTSSTIDSSRRYYFDLELTTDKFGEGAIDEFYDWARNRSDEIADQVAAAAQNDAPDTDPSAGLFAALPLSSPAAYGISSGPVYGYSAYSGAIDPYSFYSRPYLGFQSFPWIVVSPFRFRSGVSRWPGIRGAPYHAPSVVTRWPRPTPIFPSRLPATPFRYPVGASTYRMGTSLTRPAIPASPRIAPVAPRFSPPHVSAPHVGGHR